MKKTILAVAIAVILLAVVLVPFGCAKTWNNAARDGGLLFSTNGDYVHKSKTAHFSVR